MSTAQQDLGFALSNLVVIGKTNVRQFLITGLQVADVTSAEWAMFALSPVEQTAPQTALITKTDVAGLTLTNVGADLQIELELDPADTASLAGGDYFYRLDYVAAAGGDQIEQQRGRIRLTPRA